MENRRFQNSILPSLWAIALGGSLLWASPITATPQKIRATLVCPNHLEDLIPPLLRDLPSYANRVSQRAYLSDQDPEIPGYVLLTSQPDYQPLTLGPGERSSLPYPEGAPEGGAKNAANAIPGDPTRQVFFTTLERQYVSGQAIRLQHYHWLFLTPTQNEGWRLVLLFSAIGDYPGDRPASSPQDASQGVIAQAIRLWLRDCRAGSIDSL